MLVVPFRCGPGALYPRLVWQIVALLALLAVILAGCGGASKPNDQSLQGNGFRFVAPASWAVVRGDKSVAATSGPVNRVEVLRFKLVKEYRPAALRRRRARARRRDRPDRPAARRARRAPADGSHRRPQRAARTSSPTATARPRRSRSSSTAGASSSSSAAAEPRPRALPAFSSSRPSPSTERRREVSGPWRPGAAARPRPGPGASACGGLPSNAAAKTSSIVSAGMNSSASRVSGGSSARSGSFSRGRITRLSPARCAASDFSRIPPIGSTWPGQRDLAGHADVVGDRLVRGRATRSPSPSSRPPTARPSAPRPAGRGCGRRASRTSPPATPELARCASAPTRAPPAPTPASRRRAGRSSVSLPLPGYAVASMKSTSPPADV